MSIGGVIGLIVFIILLGVPMVWMIMLDTKSINKEKELRAALEQLSKDAAAMPSNASAEDIAALAARAEALGRDIEEWRRSPFVVSKRPT